MVTTEEIRLRLKEHRKAKKISAQFMADALGIERESVHRIEREWWRLKGNEQAIWARVCGVDPSELWRKPGRPSLDAMIETADDDLKDTATDIVRRLVKGAPLK